MRVKIARAFKKIVWKCKIYYDKMHYDKVKCLRNG